MERKDNDDSLPIFQTTHFTMDDEQRQMIVNYMADFILHVYSQQEQLTHEQPQHSRKNSF